jgi:hypothetical protein
MTNETSVTGKNITVSDSLGNLLFFSSTQYVRDRHNNIMPGSTTLLLSGYQLILSIQSLVDDSLYYLFTLGLEHFPDTRGLFYSVIDMRLRGGFGDIVPVLKKTAYPFRSSDFLVHLDNHRFSRQ